MDILKPLVYDVGMNNGDDVAYYLTKGLRVVGIEANPDLCAGCESRFADDISQGNLKIINCAVGQNEEDRDFFIHQANHVLSTLMPQNTHDGLWRAIKIHVRRLSSIIKENGAAHFVKIDVEHMDHLILKDLLDNGIMPTYISSESHVIDVFCYLVCMGYEHFKLVDGDSVQKKFSRHRIKLVDGGSTTFSFSYHSAGPFGEDIPGPWLSKDEFLLQLMTVGLGWKDIHATIRPSKNNLAGTALNLLIGKSERPFRENLYDLLPSLFRAIRRRL